MIQPHARSLKESHDHKAGGKAYAQNCRQQKFEPSHSAFYESARLSIHDPAKPGGIPRRTAAIGASATSRLGTTNDGFEAHNGRSLQPTTTADHACTSRADLKGSLACARNLAGVVPKRRRNAELWRCLTLKFRSGRKPHGRSPTTMRRTRQQSAGARLASRSRHPGPQSTISVPALR